MMNSNKKIKHYQDDEQDEGDIIESQEAPIYKGGFDSFASLIIKNQSVAKKKAPAYEWQDFALRIIKELNIPNFKRASVFKICKEEDKIFIEQCMNDTKELCAQGNKWQYFFKVVENKRKEKKEGR